MRKILFNLHLYLALVLGIFVIIIGVTGSIIAFEPEIDQMTNPALFKTKPEGQMLSVAGMFDAARKAYPGQKISMIRVPPTPENTATFFVKGGTVFMNPYTGAIQGTRTGQTWLGKVHQVHIRLMLGETGKDIVAGVTAVLIFLVATGIYLWWPVKRATVKWSASARRVNWDIHNTAGIYSAGILFILGVTGLIIHYDDDLEKWLHQRSGTKKVAKMAPSVPQPGAKPIGVDEAVAAALAAMPGTKVLYVNLPPNPKASYLVATHYPEDLTPGGRSWVNIDQYSGKPLNMQDSRSVAWGTRTIIWNRAIHTGDFLGVFSKLIMSITCLALIIQAITGYYLWWKKLRIRENERGAAGATESIA